MGSTYTIASLAAHSRVPKETIRHYARRGLLPTAKRVAPNRFLYDHRHVEALRLIRALRRRRGLPLETIRVLLPELLALGSSASRPEAWDAALRRLGRGGSTRDLLVRSATELFSSRPYGSVTVLEICRHAGVGRAGFYRHFASKDDLLLVATRTTVVDAIARFEGGGTGSASLASVSRRLAGVLAPTLPLLTQSLAGAMQRRPGHAALLRRLYRDAVVAAGAHVRGARRTEAGHGVVDAAIGLSYRRTLRLSAR